MKIKVGYLEYDFEIVDRMPEGYDKMDGIINYSKQKIIIRDDGNQTNEYLNSVVYHEIAHGLLEIMGEENSESKASMWSHYLYQTFGDYRKFLID